MSLRDGFAGNDSQRLEKARTGQNSTWYWGLGKWTLLRLTYGLHMYISGDVKSGEYKSLTLDASLRYATGRWSAANCSPVHHSPQLTLWVIDGLGRSATVTASAGSRLRDVGDIVLVFQGEEKSWNASPKPAFKHLLRHVLPTMGASRVKLPALVALLTCTEGNPKVNVDFECDGLHPLVCLKPKASTLVPDVLSGRSIIFSSKENSYSSLPSLVNSPYNIDKLLYYILYIRLIILELTYS
ncbi:uncharacterized protein RAG0_17444 [Rhynchosporium agropyri]|uniref:Uncharacterized protein n=1 Tax=Rhynchosporium agropyri TaxID=914238 RepID=A0A1E1LTU3_9HELO|nr:uncharacterized protein RAG0_17444 [Rhynchosporium agropyri]